MRNISSNLSAKQEGTPQVEVLLATFNGELYLTEFLESVALQEGVRIHLRVSDDGSTDKTLAIVESYENRFESCKIFDGPRKGPSANFFSLIDQSVHEFVALADQDDIWEKNKLLTQISFIAGNTPQLVCHDRSIINSDGLKTKNSQITVRILDLRNALIENVVFGNTILLNKLGVDLVRRQKMSNLIMFDSYIYLIFSCLGKITFVNNPLTMYRIHEGNLVGTPSNLKKLKNFAVNLNATYEQNRTFFSYNMKDIFQSDIEIFRKFFKIFESKRRIHRLLHTLRAPISRQKTSQTLIWKILVLIYNLKLPAFNNFDRKSSMKD